MKKKLGPSTSFEKKKLTIHLFRKSSRLEKAAILFMRPLCVTFCAARMAMQFRGITLMVAGHDAPKT